MMDEAQEKVYVDEAAFDRLYQDFNELSRKVAELERETEYLKTNQVRNSDDLTTYSRAVTRIKEQMRGERKPDPPRAIHGMMYSLLEDATALDHLRHGDDEFSKQAQAKYDEIVVKVRDLKRDYDWSETNIDVKGLK